MAHICSPDGDDQYGLGQVLIIEVLGPLGTQSSDGLNL